MVNSTSIQSKLAKLLEDIDGAYAPNTLRAFRADFEEFIRFCKKRRTKALPAKPETIAQFIDEVAQQNLTSASIRRKIVSIGSVHRLLELADPTKAGCVKLATRKMHRKLGRACKQAQPINREILEKMIRACSSKEPTQRLRALRDKVLLMLAYDTMARRSELVSLRFEDIEHSPSSAGIYLGKSKVDQEGNGRWLPISRQTLHQITEWQRAIKADDGFILRALSRRSVSASLGSGQVSRILKRLAVKAQLPKAVSRNISGHSLRVGAAQDWTSRGISLPQLMILGGWEKPDTAIRYVGSSRLNLEQLKNSDKLTLNSKNRLFTDTNGILHGTT
jgi:site-specific recombinase XerD